MVRFHLLFFTVWQDGARRAYTCIPLSFLGNVPINKMQLEVYKNSQLIVTVDRILSLIVSQKFVFFKMIFQM